MLVGTLEGDFQFGVLLVTDQDASDIIPSWGTTEEQVVSSESAVVIRVRHADEGSVVIRIWDDEAEVGVSLHGLAHSGFRRSR